MMNYPMQGVLPGMMESSTPTTLPTPPTQPSYQGMIGLPGEIGITSPLDRFAFKEFNKMADQLNEEELPQLYDYILKTSDVLIKHWEPRNERMLRSQSFWELGSRYAEEMIRKARGKSIIDGVSVQEGELLELNDGYLTVDKITSMVAGARWGFDVPAGRLGLEDVAQSIEELLVWADDKLDRKYSQALHGKAIRDEVHYAVLRGWITGMIIPNPNDRYLPWTYLLEDPLFIYPRYSGDELLQVIRKYTVSVIEAQSQYDTAFEYLLGKDDDDEIDIICYYDSIYKIELLVDGGSITVNGAHDRIVLQPLTKHGYTYLQGNSLNPWIIITPRGTPTRRFSTSRTQSDRESAIAHIGLDALYPIIGMIEAFELLLQMLLTEVSKGVNPPRLIFYDGFNKPEPLDLGIGGENYMIMHTQDARILDSTAMKPDAGPILQVIQERLQKGGVPSVLYGQNTGVLAGYAINLLSQGAQDVVQPILHGIQRFREIKFERMLEMYATIGYQFAGPLQIAMNDPNTGRKYMSGKYIDPSMIYANGTHVDVTFDAVTPRDSVPLIQAAVGANQAGILPLYDAMKDWVGIEDPRAAMQRLAEGMNWHDPAVQKHLARAAGMKSGNQQLKDAVLAAMAEEQAMLDMQLQQMGMTVASGQESTSQQPQPKGQAGGAGGRATNASPPANQNPITATTNQANNVAASLNVGNGGSMPIPNQLSKFLGGE